MNHPSDPEFVFLARYDLAKGTEPGMPTQRTHEPITHWVSIYGTMEDAYRGAATFVRDFLLRSSLRADISPAAITDIENSIRKGEVTEVVGFWNEEMPKYQVRVYKGVAL